MADPDLNLLIALDALLTEESVARAARRLRLSASAMSRTLARLREETGDPLLVRAGRRMVLTPCAEGLRERARNAVHEARSLLRPATPEPDLSTLRRTFTIRANEGFVEAFGARLIGAVHAEAPQLRLCFAAKTEKTPTFLREGTADLEIGVVGDMGPEVRIQALYRDRFVGVVRRDHPLAGMRKITLEHYLSFGHVVVSRHGHSHGPVDEALAAAGLERTVAAMVPSFPTALAVARASDLVALVPASFLEVPPERQKTARSATSFAFDLPVKTEPITISLMWHPRLEQDPVHRWLREVIRRLFGSQRSAQASRR
jgi:DNA-binding transcriptional LysR family regulator